MSIDDLIDNLDTLDSGLSRLQGGGAVKSQGFIAPNPPAADGIGLPFTKVPYGITPAGSKRHLINWFIPDMGVVRMYINPERITYNYKKLIQPTRTRGGYSLQYWGEDLIRLSLSGQTGSSGVEGINALYEVYRSEQYNFDAVGLTMSSGNAATNLYNAGVSAIGGAIGGALSNNGSNIGSAIASGLLGSPNNALAPRNIPSLANQAFTIEMYYMGWVFRGYFDSMNITESANDFSLSYEISFVATQRRGYRTNYFPWHKTPIGGGPNLGSHFDVETDENVGTQVSPYYSFK